MFDPDASNLVFALSAALDTALARRGRGVGCPRRARLGSAEVRRLTRATGVQVLENEIARVWAADRELAIAGLTVDYWNPNALRTQRRLEGAAGSGDVRLLLAHRPDAVFNLRPRTRVDLMLAGHTHRGQLQLPGIGPLTIASRVPREVGGGGLHSLAGRRIYVSRGVGVERGQAPGRGARGISDHPALVGLAWVAGRALD